MLLNISSALKNVGEVYDFSITVNIPAQNIYGETLEIEPVNVNGIFTSTGTEILLSGILETEVYGNCAVCLKTVSEHITAKFSEVFMKSREYVPNEDSDVEVFLYDGYEIDLSEMVLQNIIPQLPLKFICKANCNGNNAFIKEDAFNSESLPKDNPFSVLQKLLKNDEEV
ncbi:MAG: DUF177 domain-containing protein [Eubacteriales bacterium]|nr:DUF177 domain-containing protein [Eubacteriales bacterium]